MLDVDARVFINTRLDGRERVLHPATVTQPPGGPRLLVVLVVLDEADLFLDADQPVEVFYERSRKFVKHVGRVVEVIADADTQRTAFRIEAGGEPDTVELRQHFRVVTLMEKLCVRLGDETAQLADVSLCGFSVIAKGRHERTAGVEVTIEHEDERYTGAAAVQCVKQLPTGQLRYGLLCSESETALRKGLQRISMDTQRRQLRRRAAA